jgi:signal transduction histidine kinase
VPNQPPTRARAIDLEDILTRVRRAVVEARLPWRHLAVSGILLATLVLVAMLTWQAWESVRRQQAIAVKALGDRAAFAAAAYRSRVEAEFYIAASAEFRPIAVAQSSRGPHSVVDPSVLHRTSDAALSCRCVTAISSHSFFRLDLTSGRLFLDAADTLGPRYSTSVAQLVSLHATTRYGNDWQFAAFTDHSTGVLRVIVYTLVRSVAGRPLYAYGFIADTSAVRAAVFDRALRYTEMIPGETGALDRTNAVLSVDVRERDGDVLYQSQPAYQSVYHARTKLADFLDLMSVGVSLNPSTAMSSLVGPNGQPSLRLLTVLMALTAFLLTTALALSSRAAELARLRTDFTSSVSHELRTPLTQVLLYAETLALGRTQTAAEAREVARVVARETRRLIQLVDNTLQFERGERRLLGPNPTTQALAPLVTRAVEDFRSLLTGQHVIFGLELDEDAVAAVDTDAVRQILFNLLDNAVRYGPPSQTIRVDMYQSGEWIRLSVTDQGPGIQHRDRKRVWKPYVRLPVSVREGIPGTGLGLAIVRRLTLSHGGRVGMLSQAQGGVSIFVELPRSAVATKTPDGEWSEERGL